MMKASSNIIFHIYASENYCKDPFAGVEIRLFQRSKKERELCDVAIDTVMNLDDSSYYYHTRIKSVTYNQLFQSIYSYNVLK